jgi:hypothetical protein
MEWPADKVERQALDRLLPYARNARTHSDEQIAQIAASMREWGWTNPVLVDEEGTLIAGHGRVLAARQLGLTEVPVMTARGWSRAQKEAYRLADNKLALNAGWDIDMLRLELSDLVDMGFDPELTGFAGLELDELLGRAAPGESRVIGNLADRFGVVPFSVLNAREGWWQERKNGWISLGIKSELGRGEVGPNGSQGDNWKEKRQASNAAAPGGSLMPGVSKKTGKIVRTNNRARPIDAG